MSDELYALADQYRKKWGHEANLSEFPDYFRDKEKEQVMRYILQTGEGVFDGHKSYINKLIAYIETKENGGRKTDGSALPAPCPFCGGTVIYHQFSDSAWGYECQTKGCMEVIFRGL